MTQAMYHRSLAAQHQSRAGDQWAFFQAKRIRGSTLESSVELLQGLSHPEPFSFARADEALVRMEGLLSQTRNGPGGEDPAKAAATAVKNTRDLISQLNRTASSAAATELEIPRIEFTPLPEPGTRQTYDELVQAIQQRKTESETATLVSQLDPATIDQAIRLAEDDADRFDKACEPANETVKRLRVAFRDLATAVRPLRILPTTGGPPHPGYGPGSDVPPLFDRLDASFRAAVMDYEARRYRQEAAYNRRAAEAYEVRVRRSGVESDRHRERSK